MNDGYVFHASCPQCAAPLAHCAGGVPKVFTVNAIAVCKGCTRRYMLTVQLTTLDSLPRFEDGPDDPLEPVWDRSAPFAPLVQALMDAQPTPGRKQVTA